MAAPVAVVVAHVAEAVELKLAMAPPRFLPLTTEFGTAAVFKDRKS